MSVEDRCIAVSDDINRDLIRTSHFLEISDPDQPKTEPFEARYKEMNESLHNLGLKGISVIKADLLAPLDDIDQILTAILNESTPHILFDITSMPKRWFFPIIRRLISDLNVETLILTYTSAAHYSSTLSSNPEPIRPIPGFSTDDARTEHDMAIVGIGFEPLGLDELYTVNQVQRVHYLFPFPPGPPGFHRNWGFVRKLEKAVPQRDGIPDGRWHIHMYDSSGIFDALCRMTLNGASTSILAPYGPKPMSLAMCLFSISAQLADKPQVPVYYAQPRRYDIQYSAGVKTTHHGRDIQGYLIKNKSLYLYKIN